MATGFRSVTAFFAPFAGLLLVSLGWMALTGMVIPGIINTLLVFGAFLTLGVIQFVLWGRTLNSSQPTDDENNNQNS